MKAYQSQMYGIIQGYFREWIKNQKVKDPEGKKRRLPFIAQTLYIHALCSQKQAKKNAERLLGAYFKIAPFTIAFINKARRYSKAIRFVRDRYLCLVEERNKRLKKLNSYFITMIGMGQFGINDADIIPEIQETILGDWYEKKWKKYVRVYEEYLVNKNNELNAVEYQMDLILAEKREEELILQELSYQQRF
jgi:hypothetical protein